MLLRAISLIYRCSLIGCMCLSLAPVCFANSLSGDLFSDGVFDLNSLDGSNGFVINGVASGDQLGTSVAGVGDLNNDGRDDLVVGAYYGAGRNGQAYVIYGGYAGAVLELGTLDGTHGYTMTGAGANDNAGISVAGPGDLNQDDIPDILVGAWKASPNPGVSSGAVYVVFGGVQHPSLTLGALTGSQGFVLHGEQSSDRLGYPVSGAGDVNGDGVQDMIAGAKGAGSGGKSYVVYGGAGVGASGSVSAGGLSGSQGFVFSNSSSLGSFADQVAGIGDINNDGFDDVIVSSPTIGRPVGVRSVGAGYVVYGGPTLQSITTADILGGDGSRGFVMRGLDQEDFLGSALAGGGDFNGDGIDDFIIAADYGDPNGVVNSGETYVIYGGQAFGAELELDQLSASQGFVINGIDRGDYAGHAVANADDINGDGIDDILVGAWNAEPGSVQDTGVTYVVYGGHSGSTLNLSDLDGTNGFAINGIAFEDYSGVTVSGAGDVNGDGINDLIIGAIFADPNGKDKSGQTYVIYGQVPEPGSLALVVLGGLTLARRGRG